MLLFFRCCNRARKSAFCLDEDMVFACDGKNVVQLDCNWFQIQSQTPYLRWGLCGPFAVQDRRKLKPILDTLQHNIAWTWWTLDTITIVNHLPLTSSTANKDGNPPHPDSPHRRQKESDQPHACLAQSIQKPQTWRRRHDWCGQRRPRQHHLSNGDGHSSHATKARRPSLSIQMGDSTQRLEPRKSPCWLDQRQPTRAVPYREMRCPIGDPCQF